MVETGEKLFEEVLADARNKAERTRKRGEREAQAAARKIDEQIEAEVELIVAEGRRQAESRQREIMATVEIEAQRERLSLLEQSLTAVRTTAAGMLGKASDKQRRESAEKLARQALSMVPAGEYELSLPAALHQAEAERLAAELTGMAADGSAAGDAGGAITVRAAAQPAEGDGPILRSTDGRAAIDQTLSERLRRLWPELRLIAGKSLFG